MKSTSAASAPTPGDGIEAAADVWASSKTRSSMPRLLLHAAGAESLFRLFLTQLFVANHKVRHREAQQRAHGPRHDDAPKHPVRKAKHVRQAIDVAPVAIAITEADRINA